ncbi:MAG: GNAT family N-acetyltransferase, partial [Janthinobacterium lividum]
MTVNSANACVPQPVMAMFPLEGALWRGACSSSLVPSVVTSVRVARMEDSSAACELLRRSILELCVVDHNNDPEVLSAWLGNKTPENVASWFSSPQHFAVVALHDDVVTGVALLTRKGKVCLCHVAPEARHTGTGRALLEALERQAMAWDIGTLQVASTLVAQEFYRRNGYVP